MSYATTKAGHDNKNEKEGDASQAPEKAANDPRIQQWRHQMGRRHQMAHWLTKERTQVSSVAIIKAALAYQQHMDKHPEVPVDARNQKSNQDVYAWSNSGQDNDKPQSAYLPHYHQRRIPQVDLRNVHKHPVGPREQRAPL
jgi:hypothetical protein